MAAVDDCISAVITSPTATSTSTPSMLPHQTAPEPARTAGRSAGCNRSARPPMPCCRVVNPKSTSPNPESAAPAPDTPPAAQKLDQRTDEDHRQRSGGERDADADERDQP